MTGLVIVCALLGAAALFSIGCIAYCAAQKKKQTRIPEFYPPKGFSPLDVLIAYKGKNARGRDVFDPLMLYWASKGYITIEEECGRGLVLHKKKAFSERGGARSKTHFLEKELFDSIFEKSDTFYTLAAPSDINDDFATIQDLIKDKAKENCTKTGKKLAVAMQAATFAAVVASMITLGVAYRVPVIVLALFPTTAVLAVRLVNEKKYITVPFFGVWGGVPLIVLLALGDMYQRIAVALAFTLLALTVFVFERYIDLRSPQAMKDYAHIDSFRRFLLDVEQERVDMLVEDDPSYYFDILPYCYILNITHKLKFTYDRVTLDGAAWYLGEIRNVLMF